VFTRRSLDPQKSLDARRSTEGSPGLAKSAAAVDTLLITCKGFRSEKIPVPDYRMELDTIRLQPESDGFEIRKPSERTLTCGTSTPKVFDMDMVCESGNDSLHASVYVQSVPVSCGPLSALNYTVEAAWIKVAEGIQPLTQVLYDGGGNHKNDRIVFEWKGKFYSFYHSSFGFGWRACAPLDCMQICEDKECRTVLYDGCNRTTCAGPPALKVVCAVVTTKGTVPELLDPWRQQSGTPVYPRLPCNGDPVCQ
jgi:hypothetical protein